MVFQDCVKRAKSYDYNEIQKGRAKSALTIRKLETSLQFQESRKT